MTVQKRLPLALTSPVTIAFGIPSFAAVTRSTTDRQFIDHLFTTVNIAEKAPPKCFPQTNCWVIDNSIIALLLLLNKEKQYAIQSFQLNSAR